jgi:hypothetical protein
MSKSIGSFIPSACHDRRPKQSSRLRKEQSCSFTPPVGLHCLWYGELYLSYHFACHDLNVVLGAATKLSVKSTNLVSYGICAFCLRPHLNFPGSNQSCTIFNLKRLNDMRSKQTVASVQIRRHDSVAVRRAYRSYRSSASTRCLYCSRSYYSVSTFEIFYLVSLIVWYGVLFQINVVGKHLPRQNCYSKTHQSLRRPTHLLFV